MRAEPRHKFGVGKAGLWSAFFLAAGLGLAGTGRAQMLGIMVGAGLDAKEMFEGVVDMDRIRVDWGGKVSHPGPDRGASCVVLGVDLAPDASPAPPRANLRLAPEKRFGGAWKPTPAPPKAPRQRDLVDLCGAFMDKGALRGLKAALEQPGSFVLQDWTGTLLQVYAPGQRLAISIRLKR